MVRDQDFLYHDGRPWTETSFVALNSVSTPEDFKLPPLGTNDAYVIVPATFDPGHKGGFFLSVVCDGEFSFKLDKGGEGKQKEIDNGGNMDERNLRHPSKR